MLASYSTAKTDQTDSKDAADEPVAHLATFDLDFPGGKPAQLVEAIEASSGRSLNVIIPNQYAEIIIPKLKMRHVDVAHLFQAISLASPGNAPVVNPFNDYNTTFVRTSFGFKTDGKATDESVWYFSGDLPLISSPPRQVQFFLLTPYLEQGLTVDDITTAIETGWKMLGHPTKGEISFHKETKLLIVVGDNTKLQAVRFALDVLKAPKPAPAQNATPEHVEGDSKAAK